MDMICNAGARRASHIHPHIETIGIIRFFQQVDRFPRHQHPFHYCFVIQVIKIGGMLVRGGHEMAVAIRECI
jgi:hypothetical protein